MRQPFAHESRWAETNKNLDLRMLCITWKFVHNALVVMQG